MSFLSFVSSNYKAISQKRVESNVVVSFDSKWRALGTHSDFFKTKLRSTYLFYILFIWMVIWYICFGTLHPKYTPFTVAHAIFCWRWQSLSTTDTVRTTKLLTFNVCVITFCFAARMKNVCHCEIGNCSSFLAVYIRHQIVYSFIFWEREKNTKNQLELFWIFWIQTRACDIHPVELSSF